MKRLSLTFFGVVVACARSTPTVPAPLFDCRVAIQPLKARIGAAGLPAGREIRAASDLGKLEVARRYPFVLLPSGALLVADAAPEGDYGDQTQALLADGGPVRAAGGLRVERTNEALLRVTLDADSFAYCPTPDS